MNPKVPHIPNVPYLPLGLFDSNKNMEKFYLMGSKQAFERNLATVILSCAPLGFTSKPFSSS